ncbi:MAG: hypothetical protein PHO08_01920 [Methylococcales bacterium]|nr:hypothetical protein [Methylococcales bacterium]
MNTIFQDRHSGMDSLRALTGHIRLSCLMPFGLMQICSRQICAGTQAPWMDLSLPSHTTTLRAGHGTGYPLPGGYNEFEHNLTK